MQADASFTVPLSWRNTRVNFIRRVLPVFYLLILPAGALGMLVRDLHPHAPAAVVLLAVGLFAWLMQCGFFRPWRIEVEQGRFRLVHGPLRWAWIDAPLDELHVMPMADGGWCQLLITTVGGRRCRVMGGLGELRWSEPVPEAWVDGYLVSDEDFRRLAGAFGLSHLLLDPARPDLCSPSVRSL